MDYELEIEKMKVMLREAHERMTSLEYRQMQMAFVRGVKQVAYEKRLEKRETRTTPSARGLGVNQRLAMDTLGPQSLSLDGLVNKTAAAMAPSVPDNRRRFARQAVDALQRQGHIIPVAGAVKPYGRYTQFRAALRNVDDDLGDLL